MNQAGARPRIVLTGYFSRGNLGDDAMVEGLEGYLREKLPESDIRPVAFPPSTSIRALPAFIKELRAPEWVVLAGGTNFHDSYGVKSWRLLAQMAAVFGSARLAGVRIAFSGIGIGPLRTRPGRHLTRALLALSDSTTVRDAASLREAEGLRPGSARLGSDLALLSPPPAAPASAGPGRRLGLSLVGYHAMYGLGAGKDEEMLDVLAGAIAEQAASGLIDGVDIFPFSRAGVYSDLAISQGMARRLVGVCNTSVVVCDSPVAVRERMSGLIGFVGARFHSLVLAYQAGLPIVPVLYHEKCASLVEELALNKDGTLAPPSFLDAARVRQLLEGLLLRPEEFRAGLDLQEAQERAVHTAGLLLQAIEGDQDETDQGALGAALPGFRRAA